MLLAQSPHNVPWLLLLGFCSCSISSSRTKGHCLLTHLSVPQSYRSLANHTKTKPDVYRVTAQRELCAAIGLLLLLNLFVQDEEALPDDTPE
jgi:hypothetical protein